MNNSINMFGDLLAAIAVRFQMYVMLVFCVMISYDIQAATLIVDGSDATVADDGVCTLVEAITASNNNAASGATPGECIAGSGTDTIQLTVDVTLSQAAVLNDSFYGNTALPYINSNIVIDGMGHSLQRDSNLSCNVDSIADPSEFRLFFVDETGVLLVQNIMISHGCVDSETFADRFFGGVFWNEGDLSIDNVVFSMNKALLGGVIFNNEGIGYISNSIFSDNEVYRNGGAIYNNSFRTISSINNSLFINNETADREGGAIYNRGSIPTLIDNSFVNNSSVSSGGGIYNKGNIGVIENNTFSGNSSDSSGGAISNGESLGGINNSTFVNNHGSVGGAIHSAQGNSTLNNSLFMNNTSNFSNTADCYTQSGGNPVAVFSGTHNLSNKNNHGCQITIDSDLSSTTVDGIADNGCTIPLADGSCVLTHALLLGSQALDAADAVSATSLDQRQYPIENLTRDIGAFEANVDLIFKDGFD
jgi:hypothetical protein